MCPNITPLRGLEPPATETEIEPAALQYVRKGGALSAVTDANRDAVTVAVFATAEATRTLLRDLPPRKAPPVLQPPLRRIACASVRRGVATCLA